MIKLVIIVTLLSCAYCDVWNHGMHWAAEGSKGWVERRLQDANGGSQYLVANGTKIIEINRVKWQRGAMQRQVNFEMNFDYEQMLCKRGDVIQVLDREFPYDRCSPMLKFNCDAGVIYYSMRGADQYAIHKLTCNPKP